MYHAVDTAMMPNETRQDTFICCDLREAFFQIVTLNQPALVIVAHILNVNFVFDEQDHQCMYERIYWPQLVLSRK